MAPLETRSQIGGAQLGRDLHRARQFDHAGTHALFLQPVAQDRRIARGDAHAFQLRRTLPVPGIGNRKHQAAAAETKGVHFPVGIGQTEPRARGGLLVQLIAPDYSEVAHAVGDQPGNVVVAHQQ